MRHGGVDQLSADSFAPMVRRHAGKIDHGAALVQIDPVINGI